MVMNKGERTAYQAALKKVGQGSSPGMRLTLVNIEFRRCGRIALSTNWELNSSRRSVLNRPVPLYATKGDAYVALRLRLTEKFAGCLAELDRIISELEDTGKLEQEKKS